MDDFEKWMKSVPTKKPDQGLDERLERLFENAEWDARKQKRIAWPIGWVVSACAACAAVGFWMGRGVVEEEPAPSTDWNTGAQTFYVIEMESEGVRNVFDVPPAKQPFLSGKTKVIIIDEAEREPVVKTVNIEGNPS